MHTKLGSPGFWGRIPSAKTNLRDVTNTYGMDISWFIMGEESDRNAPTAVALKMEPYAILVRHAHNCERFEVVVQGQVHIGDGVILGPGDCMQAKKGEMYGPFMAGPEGCITYEIFSVQDGTTQAIYDTEHDGPVTVQVGDQNRPEGLEEFARRRLGPWPG